MHHQFINNTHLGQIAGECVRKEEFLCEDTARGVDGQSDLLHLGPLPELGGHFIVDTAGDDEGDDQC